MALAFNGDDVILPLTKGQERHEKAGNLNHKCKVSKIWGSEKSIEVWDEHQLCQISKVVTDDIMLFR